MKKIVLKNGEELFIRKAIAEDAEQMAQYKAVVCRESDFLSFGENEIEITAEKEQKKIELINAQSNSIIAVALINGEIVGSISFTGGEKIRTRHVGEMGITVKKQYWNFGIGSILLEVLIEWATETGVIKKINLRTRADNYKAMKLYEKYGFKREGILTKDICVNQEFYDSVSMGVFID